MSYSYEAEKPWVFTDEGQRALLQMRDWVQSTLKTAGAFQAGRAMGVVSTPDSWKACALLDRLVELGDAVEIPGQACMSQHRIYRGKDTW